MGEVARRRIEVPALPGPIDKLEKYLYEHGGIVRKRGGGIEGIPHIHKFTPGLYIRELHMPPGTLITSEVHATEHPYVISSGSCYVFTEDAGWRYCRAPHTGITLPGTKRVVFALDPLVWTTFHVTNLTDLEEIEAYIFEDRHNPILDLSGET